MCVLFGERLALLGVLRKVAPVHFKTTAELVDSPQQSVGDMSGKTFLLLLTVILCARACFRTLLSL